MGMSGMMNMEHSTGASSMSHAQGSDNQHAMGAGGHAESHGGLGEGSTYPILRLLVDKKVTYTRKLPTNLSDIPAPRIEGFDRPISLAMRHMGGWTINDHTFDMNSSPIVVKKTWP